jgi:hypothetical protein
MWCTMRPRQDLWTSFKSDEGSRACGLAAWLRQGLGRAGRGFFVVVGVGVGTALAPGLNGGAWAQDDRRDAEAQSPPLSAFAPESAEALSVRYRFVETYGVEEDPSQPDLITQYQVGVRENFKSVREKAQGAPDRTESSTLTVYTERSAKVSKSGEISDAVRRYDRFDQKGLRLGAAEKAPLFQGLTTWIHRGAPGSAAQILSLTSDRPLREAEFNLMIGQPSFPPLKVLLPTTPRRVADTWRILPGAASYLFCELPDLDGYNLNAKLSEVRKAANGAKLVAVIAFSGELTVAGDPSLVNGEILFEFEPPPATAGASGRGGAADAAAKSGDRSATKSAKEGVVDARGWITEVRMARLVETHDEGDDGRYKTTDTHEILLKRRPLSAAKNQPGGQPAPLVVPNPPPTATETNSWLVYEDPLGRFHFRHPQPLRPLFGDEESLYRLQLADVQGGKDRLAVLLPPKEAAADVQLAFQDVGHFQRSITQGWIQQKREVLRGPAGFLSGKEWEESHRKVYRLEAGLKSQKAEGQAEGRVFIDYYLVDFGRNKTIVVESWTDRDDHVSFRTEAEGVIKSFEFGPWKPRGQAEPRSSTSAPPPR